MTLTVCDWSVSSLWKTPFVPVHFPVQLCVLVQGLALWHPENRRESPSPVQSVWLCFVLVEFWKELFMAWPSDLWPLVNWEPEKQQQSAYTATRDFSGSYFPPHCDLFEGLFPPECSIILYIQLDQIPEVFLSTQGKQNCIVPTSGA